MPCAMRSLKSEPLAYSASTWTGLKSPVTPAKLTMSASVTVLDMEAVSPTVMSANTNSFIFSSSLQGKSCSAQETSGVVRALVLWGALVGLGDLRGAVGLFVRIGLGVVVVVLFLDGRSGDPGRGLRG